MTYSTELKILPAILLGISSAFGCETHINGSRNRYRLLKIQRVYPHNCVFIKGIGVVIVYLTVGRMLKRDVKIIRPLTDSRNWSSKIECRVRVIIIIDNYHGTSHLNRVIECIRVKPKRDI